MAPSHISSFNLQICNLFLIVLFILHDADTENMYSKRTRIRIGFALFVEEYVTAACAGKQKVGLLLVLSIGR